MPYWAMTSEPRLSIESELPARASQVRQPTSILIVATRTYRWQCKSYANIEHSSVVTNVCARTCWLAFPLAVFQVESKMNRGHLTREFERQFANLNLLLRKIGVRFIGADYFSNAIHEATKSINGDIEGHEADVLDVVGRFLNLRIASNNPTE